MSNQANREKAGRMAKALIDYYISLPENVEKFKKIFEKCELQYFLSGEWPSKEKIEEMMK